MYYDYTLVDVGDADCMVINYKDDDQQWFTAVVDAGNLGDGPKLKRFIKHNEGPNGIIKVIDYAICTHPDKDHKGGFFDLFDDRRVRIENFCILRPDDAVNCDRRIQLTHDPMEVFRAAKAVYNHPTDNTRNLLDEIIAHSNFYKWDYGTDLRGIPLQIIGPSENYFKDAVFEMVNDYVELVDEYPFETYAEDELPSEEDAKSVMDEEKETSATNKASMILLFHPEGRKFLLAGDACSASIHQAIVDYPAIVGSTLKVPHHGSKHNLTTEVIELLKPVQSVISCRGSKKHPNPAIVHYLSKYGKVFSTSKSGTLTYSCVATTYPATPLRDKHD